MSAPWHAPGPDLRDDAAWEVFHENSKRGAHDRLRTARGPVAGFDHGALPILEPQPDPPPAASASGGPRRLGHEPLLRLLALAAKPLGSDDPTIVFVHLAAVTGLPVALAAYDPATPCLRLLAEGITADRVAAATASPDALRGAAAAIFLAADLEAATERAGERGYRDALIATGRHLAAFEAVATLPLSVRPVALLDREADALLFLDGLSRSVLAALAVDAAG